MERHIQNTLALAKWLETHPGVEKVNYPGLPGNPYHELAKKYLPKGAGGVLSFVLKAEKSKAVKLVEHFELVSHLANVGDAKTLIIQPSATTHSQLSAEEQLAVGIDPGLFRVSVGIEHIDDIIYDFEQAFKQVLIKINDKEKLRIGLFGYGCVGQGLHDVLNSSKGFKADIVKICVKDRTKKRRIPMTNFTFDKNDILNDPSINLVVELIDDADEAFSIVTTAMKSGKNVVTANKMMVAKHFRELVEMQEEYNVSLLYEASAGASIPIIRNLEEYYDNELLYSLRGILNGTTNYILTKMHNEGTTL